MQAPDPNAAKSVGEILFHPASIAAAVTVVLNALFLLVIKGRSDWYFNKKLKQFEHDLGKVVRDAEYDYKRNFLNFERLTEKRSIAYADIFKEASALVNTLDDMGIRAAKVRAALTSNDDGITIDFKLGSYGLPTPKVSDLRDAYYAAKRDNIPDPSGTALQQFASAFIGPSDAQMTAFATVVANNALYLKHPVERLTRELYLAANHAVVILLESNADGHLNYQEAFENLKKTMKEQLSIGDYEVPLDERLRENKRKEMEQYF